MRSGPILLAILTLLISPSACFADFTAFDNNRHWPVSQALRTFFVDSEGGDDRANGLSPNTPWQTLPKISSLTFQPGDHIYFKRGSQFTGTFIISGDGTKAHPIVIGSYGQGAAPRFTNANVDHHNGNAIQIRGDHQIIQNLHFHHTAPAEENAGFIEVWATGAVHAGLGSDYAIIRGNRFSSTPKAIQSYSEHSLISHNHIQGGNNLQQDGFLSKPYWGPIGIQIGIGNQQIAHNIITHMFVQGGEWGSDGGAIEIDDGRYHKNNIHIHHNMTQNNMGFLEISWDHDIRQRATHNVVVDYNISRDYQDFVLWWADNRDSRIHHNTIIRTEQIRGTFTDTVFLLDGPDIDVSNNVVVISDATWAPVFQGDWANTTHHNDNIYWNIDGGAVDLGVAAGSREFTADPFFVNFSGQDYRLRPDSPALGLGAWARGEEPLRGNPTGLGRNFINPSHSKKPKSAIQIPKEEIESPWIKLENTDARLVIRGGDIWYDGDERNSGGSAQTLWSAGDSITLEFTGTRIRFHGLKDEYMDAFNIRIDGVLIAENISAKGDGQWQTVLWDSNELQYGTYTVELISNGDTVEVDFITYQ